MVGPRAAATQWKGPIEKFKARVAGIFASGAPAFAASRQYNTRAVTVTSYVAQLSLPPPNIRRIEIAAINKILHLAPNSLSLASAINLRSKSAISITPLEQTMKANMRRAGLRTILDIPALYEKLVEVGRMFLHLAHVAMCKWNPIGWDSLPMVVLLRDASEFKHTSAQEQAALQMVDQKWRSSPSRPLQSKLLATMVDHVEDDWLLLFCRCIRVLFGPNLILIPVVASDCFWSSMAKRSLSVQIMALRTILHAWTTSHRYHEDRRLKCIFGCHVIGPQSPQLSLKLDTLTHYMVCPRLWSLVAELWPLPLPFNPWDRLCISSNFSDLRPLVLAHSIYHGLKQGNTATIQCSRSLRDIRRIDHIALEIGRTVARELVTPLDLAFQHPTMI